MNTTRRKYRRYNKTQRFSRSDGVLSVFNKIISNLGTYLNIDRSSKKTNRFTSLKCSPLVANTKLDNDIRSPTCYPNHVIRRLQHLWNIHHPNDQINPNISIQEVYHELKWRLKQYCNTEKCWSKRLDPYKNYNEYFAPTMPISWEEKLTTWLSNVDIWNVLSQYELVYPQFKCIYPTPIDFNAMLEDDMTCVSEELCKFDLESYIKNNTTMVGIVINLDPHYKKGSHWVSMFVNIPERLIFYFDSGGDKCPKKIRQLVSNITTQGDKLGIPFTFDQNYPFEHQRSTTECGMYVLYFIINMITGKLTPHKLKTVRIPDKAMIKLRTKYFTSN